MLGNDTGLVLDRHGIAGERHHARALQEMQVVQRRSGERLVLSRGEIGHGYPGRGATWEQTAPPSAHAPPLSRDLRDFPSGFSPSGYPRRWAPRLTRNAAFQSVIPMRS